MKSLAEKSTPSNREKYIIPLSIVYMIKMTLFSLMPLLPIYSILFIYCMLCKAWVWYFGVTGQATGMLGMGRHGLLSPVAVSYLTCLIVQSQLFAEKGAWSCEWDSLVVCSSTNIISFTFYSWQELGRLGRDKKGMEGNEGKRTRSLHRLMMDDVEIIVKCRCMSEELKESLG